ncbi:energy transducer TonB [Magnetospirillum sulfuroxidans]|uniref:Energy transducer TonB n=1 Tax=Magnetospirillum sulfuroxidans TaxID=611300 RepID=A0ABS5IAM7_9PROT|nr:energy transducer TonB [Magnetospirillum sulfuroxidans]MBR9971473.1 energy transducer TonB [Magnetospirillum sulfuroxidans]
MGKTRFRLGTALALSVLCHGGALAALLATSPPPRPVPPSQSYAVTFWHPPIPAPPQPAAPVAARTSEPAKAEPSKAELAKAELAKAQPRRPPVKAAAAKPVATPTVKTAPEEIAAPATEPTVIPASFTPLPAQPDAPPAPPPIVHRADYLSPPTPPVYPAPARRLGIEGTVIIRALVERPGIASQVTVWRSSGESLLDRSALEAVRNWRFHPMTQGGVIIAAWVEVPITFSISNT